MECPNCGIEIPKEDVRPDGFQCSRFGDHFRRAVRGGRVAGIAILFFACLLCYAAGVRGGNIFLMGLVGYVIIGPIYHMFTSMYWPKYEKDPTMHDDFPHIVLPPDPWNKP
jgi:hypothetical protein